MMRKLDVAIVGGGPGGMAAANSILKECPHFKVGVFEKARQLNRVGFTVALQRHGWRAIAAIDSKLYEKTRSVCVPDGMRVFYNPQGEETMRSASFLNARADLQFIEWYQLQKSLQDFLPTGTVHLAHALESLETGSDSVTLSFTGQPDVQASIAIGCDGNMSAVRQHVLKDGNPSFFKRAVWRGQTDAPHWWPHHENTLTFFQTDAGCFMMVVKVGSGRLAWTLSAPYEDSEKLLTRRYVDVEVAIAQNQSKVQRCLEAVKGPLPNAVLDLIAATDPGHVTEHPNSYRNPEECLVWGKGPVTLLGDAAHLGTAVLGQGTGMALEDAVELGRAIGKFGATEDALRQYEAARIPRATKVHAASVGLAKQMNAGKPISEMDWFAENPWLLSYDIEPLAAPLGSKA